MEEILIIGNKKYTKLNIDKILDSYKHNYRFNFSIPNKNNGTKYDKIVFNNHVFENVKIGCYKKLYGIYGKYMDLKYLEDFFSILKNYNSIEKSSIYNWEKYNIFLNSINCPYYFTLLPRIGYIKIMALIMDKKKPIIFGFSIKNHNDKHLYNNALKKNNCHDHKSEEKILKWLHENNYIDATLCLLKDEENIIIEDNILKPTKSIMEKLFLSI